MRRVDISYDDGILNKNNEYIVGVNDETKAHKQLTINPSFHTFTLEQKKDKE